MLGSHRKRQHEAARDSVPNPCRHFKGEGKGGSWGVPLADDVAPVMRERAVNPWRRDIPTPLQVHTIENIHQELEDKGFYRLPNGVWDGEHPIVAGDHCLWKGGPKSKKGVEFFHGLIHGVQGDFVNIS